MVEILPLQSLTEEDAQIFGSLNVTLGKLKRAGLPVENGVVITPPNLHLKSVLEHFDFGHKEIFEQSLTLVRREINKTPIPEHFIKHLKGTKLFINGETVGSVKEAWIKLLHLWIDEVKDRLWKNGFTDGITEGLSPVCVFYIKRIEAEGSAYFDSLQDDSVVNIKKGKLHPNDLKNIHDLVNSANKKLFIPHEYEWIIDEGVKLVGIKPYTASVIPDLIRDPYNIDSGLRRNDKGDDKVKSTVKIFLDFSQGLVVEREVDGVYISSEKIFDLNKPQESFENTLFKLVESSITFPDNPIFFKLADKSEGMGKVRGALRLLHQKSLFDPMVQILDFARHKHSFPSPDGKGKNGLSNIHIVVPFVRGVNEFLQIKRELAVKKLGRKNSLELWMEAGVPENIINLEDYLVGGLDGVVLNLDELIAHLNGFDYLESELTFYKSEVDGLLKFLDDGLKLMHKSKVPFIAYGSLTLNPKVLDFLIEKGVYGMVVERFESQSIHDLLRQSEKRMILRKSQ